MILTVVLDDATPRNVVEQIVSDLTGRRPYVRSAELTSTATVLQSCGRFDAHHAHDIDERTRCPGR